MGETFFHRNVWWSPYRMWIRTPALLICMETCQVWRHHGDTPGHRDEWILGAVVFCCGCWQLFTLWVRIRPCRVVGAVSDGGRRTTAPARLLNFSLCLPEWGRLGSTCNFMDVTCVRSLDSALPWQFAQIHIIRIAGVSGCVVSWLARWLGGVLPLNLLQELFDHLCHSRGLNCSYFEL